MTKNPFQKATPMQSYLKVLIVGEPKTGKSYTGLDICTTLAHRLGSRVAAIDTEYALGLYGDMYDFDAVELSKHHPDTYIETIRASIRNRYQVVFVDGFTQAWYELQEIADQEKRGWQVAMPIHRRLVQYLLRAPVHIVATVRMQDLMDSDFKKVGTRASQHKHFEHEFMVAFETTHDHGLRCRGSRCAAIAKGDMFTKDQVGELVDTLHTWVTSGIAAVPWYEREDFDVAAYKDWVASHGYVGDVYTSQEFLNLFSNKEELFKADVSIFEQFFVEGGNELESPFPVAENGNLSFLDVDDSASTDQYNMP